MNLLRFYLRPHKIQSKTLNREEPTKTQIDGAYSGERDR